MTLHLNLPLGSSHRNNNEQQQEVREARRLLKERIRTDWDYPTLPAWQSSGRTAKAEDASIEDRIAGFRFHNPDEQGRTSNGSGEVLGLDFDPVEWRERGYSSEESNPDNAPTPTSATKSKSGSTYKFDNPDSVGAQLTDRRIAKKRKRYEALEEEMEWNDGLALWMRRRDKWCCARTAAAAQQPSGGSNSNNTTTTVEDEARARVDSTSASVGSSPRTSTSSAREGEEEGEDEEDEGPTRSTTPNSSPSSTTPNLSPPSSTAATHSPSSQTTTTTTTTPITIPSPSPSLISPLEILLPIAPPLLPNHPVRRRISTTMYPEIYTKIILQSRTPSVPLNLQILVNALVQGWKDDNEWPPKNPPLERSIGRKKGASANGGGGGGGGGGLREGVKAVGRVLRLTGGGGSEASNKNHHT